MMINPKKIVLLAIPIIILLLFLLIQPSNYDDCILDSMKGVNNNNAAIQIARSCRSKFPKEQSTKKSRQLSQLELQKLEGSARIGYNNLFYADIYNGNQDLTITEITFEIQTEKNSFDDYDKNSSKTIQSYSKSYQVETLITPQSAKDLSFQVLATSSNLNWNIVDAKGYQVEPQNVKSQFNQKLPEGMYSIEKFKPWVEPDQKLPEGMYSLDQIKPWVEPKK